MKLCKDCLYLDDSQFSLDVAWPTWAKCNHPKSKLKSWVDPVSGDTRGGGQAYCATLRDINSLIANKEKLVEHWFNCCGPAGDLWELKE